MIGRSLLRPPVRSRHDRARWLPLVALLFPSPSNAQEATDKYTVVFKLSEQSLNALPMIYNEAQSGGWIYPPEVIKQYGHMQDWGDGRSAPGHTC